jgi:hypothetical protein
MENITSSRLAFRQASDVQFAEEMPYEPEHDHAWLEPVFGSRNEEAAIQDVGSVEARKGGSRMLSNTTSTHSSSLIL